MSDQPEGTIRRKVWFSETLALGLGASLVDWGEPDEDGFYSPRLTRTLAPTPPDAPTDFVDLIAPPIALREAAQALVTATDTLDDWDLRHRYVVNSERDALAGDLSSAWFNLRAALAQPKETDRE